MIKTLLQGAAIAAIALSTSAFADNHAGKQAEDVKDTKDMTQEEMMADKKVPAAAAPAAASK